MLIKHNLGGTLFKLYGWNNSLTRKYILKTIRQLEKGNLYSATIRDIYEKYHGIKIGKYSYGGCFNLSNIPAKTEFGNYCSLAQFRIFTRNHPVKYFTMHPFFYNSKLGIVPEDTIDHSPVVFGHDVWVGHNAIILPKVNKVGNGAIIAASAVVTKDVPPYAIIGGNPGKVITMRFDDDTIKRIEKTRWWELDLAELIEKRREIEKFIEQP